MNVSSIKRRDRPILLKYSSKENPHLTIETNMSCNIRCRNCYNINNSFVKDFHQICSEIDSGLGKRNFKSITLIGGEPTLHPDLVKIVKYIKQKGIICQMLTNGVLMLEDEKDQLLNSLVSAGLDKILLHVDEGQVEIHDSIDRVIVRLFQKFDKAGIFYSLSTTVFHDTQQIAAGKIRAYAPFKFFDGILALLERDSETDILPSFNESQASSMLEEYEGIYKELGISPLAYFPTSLDDSDISWLFYFFYINSKTGVVFSRSRTLLRIFFRLYRLFTGRIAFALSFRGTLFYLVFLVSSLLEIIINPLRIPSLARLMAHSRGLSALRIHTLVIQNPPQYHRSKGQFHICYHCPDATMRNGKLTPLCLADLINPLPEMEARQVPAEVRKIVYEHMGEPV